MRHALMAAGLALVLAAPVAAVAINPQPLPPGRHATKVVPPNPCSKFRKEPRTHARCLRTHVTPYNEGWEHDPGLHERKTH